LSGEAVTITRDELYAQVWSTPMRTLANKFGLSDVGLAKTCKRFNIPRPSVGYWAKKAVGKASNPTPLPKAVNQVIEFLPKDAQPSPHKVKYDQQIMALLSIVEHLAPINVQKSLRKARGLGELGENPGRPPRSFFG